MAHAVLSRAVPVLSRALALLCLAALMTYIGLQGRSLWNEWRNLQGEQAQVRRSAVVGYRNISPNPSYARKPDDWFHDEGKTTLLWSGWQHGGGHGWFRFDRGEIDRERISLPMGRDVIQAIDYPMIEVDDGEIWRRIPTEAPVIGHELGPVAAVYPLLVLNKVGVVNDEIEGQALLVVFNPPTGPEPSVDIYEPLVAGHRVTMGFSGYSLDNEPVLYDRGTESFWVRDGGALRSVAGAHKGARLRWLAHPSPVAWGDWRSNHPHSRLLIGADRSKTRPAL